MIRSFTAVVTAACLGIGATAASAAGVQPVHGHYVDKQHIEYKVSKAATLPNGTRYTKPAHGNIVVLFYMAVSNKGSRSGFYGAGSFDAVTSKSGRALKSFDPAPDYHWLSGGTLRPHRSAAGWIGFEAPRAANTVYLRFTAVIGRNNNPVVVTYHPRA